MKMIPCSDNVRHMSDETSNLFTGIEGNYFENSVTENVPIKPIDSWSRGIRRRLLANRPSNLFTNTFIDDQSLASPF
ncbi:unnamed protein product [Protopolystoma xenopodis]|uniref:Uncharacterized protein n=1 Tax=Protopolystoma xenopodis TaxID=117903 RepID=A0A448WPG8_9PLAT|nr:unnamed protein product [Protopolystoma xenopodis]